MWENHFLKRLLVAARPGPKRSNVAGTGTGLVRKVDRFSASGKNAISENHPSMLVIYAAVFFPSPSERERKLFFQNLCVSPFHLDFSLYMMIYNETNLTKPNHS